MVKTLVTGGLGFIGSNLVDALLAAGHDVVIIDNEATGHNHNSNAKVTTVIGDITVADDMAKLPKDVDYVVHLGAAISVAESMTNPEKYEKNNVEGSRAVLDWCVANNVKKIVSASTAAYYGNPEVLPCVETMDYAGISPYAETKYKVWLASPRHVPFWYSKVHDALTHPPAPRWRSCTPSTTARTVS